MKNVKITTKINISKLLLLALFAFVSVQLSSAFSYNQVSNTQNEAYKEVKGRVVDAITNSPLIFADITIDNTNIGTITNKEGEFALKIPNNQLNSSLVISFLGYSSKAVPVTDFNTDLKIIKLNPVITKLDEVSFTLPKDAKSLVKKALENNGDKYLDDKVKMTAFYRETIKKGRRNASLAEAVVNIYKEPYSTYKKDNIELLKSRKSTNYSRLDTVALKLQGGPYSTLYADMVKYPRYVFSRDFFDFYDFSFGKTTQINNRNVYVVNFKQQDNVVTPLYYGKLYIDAQNFGLVSAVYQLNVENKEETLKYFLKRKPARVKVEPLEAIYRVDYRNTNGKWYYSYSNFQLAFKVKWRKKLFGSTYKLNVEMAVTDWVKDTSDISKVNKIRPNIILSDKASGFSDPEFWGEYNIIEPEKSIESAIKKISKQLSRLNM
jgi:hypothetical protein